MADKSKIEWCDATWNPAFGCSKVSAGCKNCFAHRMISTRFPHLTGYEHGPGMGTDIPLGWDNRAHFKPDRLEIPFHWKKPRRIFVCSMSDLFHESLTNEQIAAVFGVMAATPQHQYVVLTKRLQRAMEWFKSGKEETADHMSLAELESDMYIHLHKSGYPWNSPQIGDEGRVELLGYFDFYAEDLSWPLENVIICASVEDQPTVDERVSLLLQIPARWRGVSVEPMLSGINIGPWLLDEDGLDVDGGWPQNHDGLDLVICGAETGPGKRPFKDDWALDLRDQCRDADTPFFFKKDGAGKPTLCGVKYHEWPED